MTTITATVEPGKTNVGRVVERDGKLVLLCQGFSFEIEYDPKRMSYRLHWLERDRKPVLTMRRADPDSRIWIAKEIGGTIETCAMQCPFTAAIKALWIMM